MADNKPNQNIDFIKNLTRLFRSGASIRKSIRSHEHEELPGTGLTKMNYQSTYGGFRKETSFFNMTGPYGVVDRQAKYAEFNDMEYEPMIATALNVISEEVCAGDEDGRSLHVYSDNPDIKKALNELFYEVMNVDAELRPWVRNSIKNGDCFIFLEVHQRDGIVQVDPLPVNFVEREEKFDKEDPYAVRFKLINAGSKYFEYFQMCHFRLLANDAFRPYGTSHLEACRRVWRNLLMLEDAMLLYRIVRSPERRVFYIDVTGVQINEVPNFVEQVKQGLKSNFIVDKNTGRNNQYFNPVGILEDYYLPTRPNSLTKVETLPGGTNATAIQDVEYMRNKLVSALQMPKAYLNFADSGGTKTNLSQLDVRFSKTVKNLQQVFIAELTRVAQIHLYAKGFDGQDLLDFKLKMTNPSSMAAQQKLNLLSMKFDIADKAKTTELVSQQYIQEEILGLSLEQIGKINQQKEQEALYAKKLEALQPTLANKDNDSTLDPFDKSNYELVPGTTNPAQQNNSTQPQVSYGVVDNNQQTMPTVEPVIKVNQTPKNFSFLEGKRTKNNRFIPEKLDRYFQSTLFKLDSFCGKMLIESKKEYDIEIDFTLDEELENL